MQHMLRDMQNMCSNVQQCAAYVRHCENKANSVSSYAGVGLSLAISIDSNTGLNIHNEFRVEDLEFPKVKLNLKFCLNTFP